MTEQAEIDTVLQAEYGRLQIHLRSLEKELKILVKNGANLLKRENKLAAALRSEHHQLSSEIICLQKGSYATKRNVSTKFLEYFMKGCLQKQKLFKERNLNIYVINERIKMIHKEIRELRRNNIPDICYYESILKVRTEITRLENRLEAVNTKYSYILTENTEFRKHIDHMLQNRGHFNNIWSCIVKQFNDGKKHIADLIEQSTFSYDQREELCNKLQISKDKHDADKIINVQEMRDLQRKLEYDEKLQKFYNTKGTKRINIELEEREANKRLLEKQEYETQLADYKKIIKRITELSNEENVNTLSVKFITQEEENFALFNYVNELSHEVELLCENSQNLKAEISNQKLYQQESAFKKRTEKVTNLLKSQEATVESTRKSNVVKTTTENELHKLLKGVQHMLRSKTICWNAQ